VEGSIQVARQNGLTHAGCWAHARRKFVKARKVQPKGKAGQADKALKLIRRLYTVEQQARTMNADERLALRQRQSQPIIDRLKDWLETQLHRVPPKTALGKTLHYLSQQWPRLTRFLDDGQIPLDNNPAENAIRPFVIGRKNWLFSDTPKGAHASARIYSLIDRNGQGQRARTLRVYGQGTGASCQQPPPMSSWISCCPGVRKGRLLRSSWTAYMRVYGFESFLRSSS